MSDPDLDLDLDPDDLPPELRPVPLDWSDLDSPAVERAVRSLSAEELADLPEEHWLYRGVLALGLGVRDLDDVLPTRAGAIAFAHHPEHTLPGAALVIHQAHTEPTHHVGSTRRLLAHTSKRHGHLAASLLLHALAWRSWDDDDLGEPTHLHVTDHQLLLRFPGEPADDCPNPVLADLFERRGWSASLDRQLRTLGIRGMDTTSDDGWTELSVELVRRKPARRPASASEPMVSVQREVTPTRQPASDRQAALLAHLRDHRRPLSRRELQDALGWTRSTIRDVLRALVEQGRVRTLTPSPRSPFQVYDLVERQDHPRPPARTRRW